MKKVIIVITLMAFISAGAFSVNSVQAKVTKDVKIEMLKLSQDPVKAKDSDKTKKTDKPAVAPSATSATGQGNAPAPRTSKNDMKTNYPKAKKEACVSGAAKPDKK